MNAKIIEELQYWISLVRYTEKLLNITWKKVIKKNKQIQAGFRAGRSTIDTIFVIKQLIDKTNNNRHEVYFNFVDMENTVPLQKLWETSEDMEIDKIGNKAIKKLV